MTVDAQAGTESPSDGRRNVVLCFDGTNNEFGSCNTNVVRVAQVIVRRPNVQSLFYDPGVGTLPEPSAWLRPTKAVSRAMALAFATDLHRQVMNAYAYLMDFWEPNARVYMFGFSRGAFAARVLAGMLHTVGLLPRGSHNLLPYAWRLFRSVPASRDDASKAAAYWKLCDDFRWSFARPVGVDPDRRFPTHFLGLWDTVSSVGWAWEPQSFPFTARNPSVAIARHAMALDERRAFFRANRLAANAPGQSLDERWFAGVHSDVGGGYPEADGGLWRRPFEWILAEAREAQLLVDRSRLDEVLGRSAASLTPWDDPKHESLRGAWRLAEWFPKKRWDAQSKRYHYRINRGRPRDIHDGEKVDESLLNRLRGDYRPPNLSAAFREAVRALPQVAGPLPYAS